jgi:hypothetical protein
MTKPVCSASWSNLSLSSKAWTMRVEVNAVESATYDTSGEILDYDDLKFKVSCNNPRPTRFNGCSARSTAGLGQDDERTQLDIVYRRINPKCKPSREFFSRPRSRPFDDAPVVERGTEPLPVDTPGHAPNECSLILRVWLGKRQSQDFLSRADIPEFDFAFAAGGYTCIVRTNGDTQMGV